MSDRDSNAEIFELLEFHKSMVQMEPKFEKEWLDIERPLDLCLSCSMTSRILVEFKKMSFEEIMLTLNFVFVGHSDGESVFSIKNQNEKRYCILLLNNLVKIMDKLTICSSKLFIFRDQIDSLSNDAKFGMSALLLRIIRTISVHLDTAKNTNLPEYVALLLQELTDDFLILKLWLYDFICSFSIYRDYGTKLVAIPGSRDLTFF